MTRSKAKRTVLATEDTEVTEKREGRKVGREEGPSVFLRSYPPTFLPSFLCVPL
jgi:hypothetical protein